MEERGYYGTAQDREWLTRKKRIDPKLRAAGWDIIRFESLRPLESLDRSAIEEYATENGPADYALCLEGHVVGIVEAKKLTLGPQNVLTQAERYSRGATTNPLNFDGYRVPFLYSTNSEVIWFRDARHSLNRSRRIAHFHTPGALAELLSREFDGDCRALAARPNEHPRMRPYQVEANAAIEQAVGARKRQMLVAMATGTGKTFTMVNQVYRLMKSGVARRILFLVDRRALAAQAVRAFASFEPEPGLKFDQIYEVYSQSFQRGDFGADEKFDPKKLPNSYLTDPNPSHAFVYISTIQRMEMNLFGRDAVLQDFAAADESPEEDADHLDIPIHAFDVVIADECHRGYTSTERSLWRNTLDHFDAIKIGLTATPAGHTKAYFTDVVFRYEYERAVREGYLVDYDVVRVKSDVRLNGVFLKEGEQVGMVNPQSGAEQLDLLEDERQFDTTEVERTVTAPDSNRKILEELKKYAEAHEEEYGRFPKTLIFAVNDLPHTSHSDMLVDLARDVFGRGEAFVQKITGRVDRPLQRIREFRNRPDPKVVVTVDLLTTGVDIPDLEFIVFLRPVKSRILFEQMLGRGTRLGEHFPNKSYFTVFDCFDGTLLDYFRNATGITAEPPEKETRTIAQIVEDIWQNRDRDYNVRVLVRRLQRIDKQMAADARDLFARYVANGDLAEFAVALPRRIRDHFKAAMDVLRDSGFQDLLVSYPRPPRSFFIAYEAEDAVSSEKVLREGGREYRPEDYLNAFWRFIRENAAQVEAIQILLDRPSDWSTQALTDLRNELKAAPEHFTPENLEWAHRVRYDKALVDVISMVKHAADQAQQLFTAEERVNLAITKLTRGRRFTREQQQWLERIRSHLVANLSIDQADFEEVPVFSLHGGWRPADRAFNGELGQLLQQMNEAVAA